MMRYNRQPHDVVQCCSENQWLDNEPLGYSGVSRIALESETPSSSRSHQNLYSYNSAIAATAAPTAPILDPRFAFASLLDEAEAALLAAVVLCRPAEFAARTYQHIDGLSTLPLARIPDEAPEAATDDALDAALDAAPAFDAALDPVDGPADDLDGAEEESQEATVGNWTPTVLHSWSATCIVSCINVSYHSALRCVARVLC